MQTKMLSLFNYKNYTVKGSRASLYALFTAITSKVKSPEPTASLSSEAKLEA
jgi:hypothetical protein